MGMGQIVWLDKTLRQDEGFLHVDVKQLHGSLDNIFRAVLRIQRLTKDHVKSLLESQADKHSSAERMLICQLLVDLERSLSSDSVRDMAAADQEQKNPSGDDQRNFAALLCETGDHNGALSLLYKIPRRDLGMQDLRSIVKIGTVLCARMKLIPEALGIGDDPMVSAVFEQMDVLVLPHLLLADYPNQGTGPDAFIRKSFMWPWIRRSLWAQLKDQSGAPMDWSATRLDLQFRDFFGHSFLHAAIFSQYYHDSYSWEFIKTSLDSGQENAMAQLQTTWPSYAQGFTPLASSVSPLAARGSMDTWELFKVLLSSSNVDLCRGSSIGTACHEFCALACAVRCRDTAVVEALVQRSTRQGNDISDCCLWVLNWVPGIWVGTRDLLVSHLGIPKSARVSNGNGERLLEL